MLDREVSGQPRNVLVTTLVPSHKKRRNMREHATFGERLRRLRRDRHLTQVQLAKRLGTDASYVARLETGKIESPGLESLRRISEALDVPVSTLTGESGKGGDVERAIQQYPGLDEEAKRTLIRMFRALDESKE